MRGDLCRKRLGQAFEGELGRRVGTDSGECEPAAHAAHLHDGAGPLTAHVRQHRADQRRGAEEVQIHQVPQFLVGGLLHRPDQAEARVVDDDVDAAVPQHRVGDGRGDACGVGDVQLGCDGPVGVRGDKIVERFGPAGRGHDRVPGGEGGGRDRTAEAGGGSRDEPDAPRRPVAVRGTCLCIHR